MKECVGRIVHYVSYGTPGGEYQSVCRMAHITEAGAWVTLPGEIDRGVNEAGRPVRKVTQVWYDDACVLQVINPQGLFFNVCRRDEAKASGTWHWPGRVEA